MKNFEQTKAFFQSCANYFEIMFEKHYFCQA